jgi:integrase
MIRATSSLRSFVLDKLADHVGNSNAEVAQRFAQRRHRLLGPATAELLDALRLLRRALGAVTGPMFPREKERGAAMRAEMLDQWLRAAEAKAGVPKLRGGLWHPYRRKWATERKHLPLPDVMAAGGWRDATTVSNCYQQADEATMFQVMSAPAKLVSRVVGGSRGETVPETAPVLISHPANTNPASPK